MWGSIKNITRILLTALLLYLIVRALGEVYNYFVPVNWKISTFTRGYLVGLIIGMYICGQLFKKSYEELQEFKANLPHKPKKDTVTTIVNRQ